MRYRWLADLILLLLSFGVAGGVKAAGDTKAEIAQIDTAKYPNITLYVNVVDGEDRIVEGLAQADFAITEDGVPVEITAFSAGIRSAIATVLTIDRSSSMGVEGKLDGAKDAAATFVGLMREQDQAALVAFDSTVVPLQPFTGDRRALSNQIQALSLGDCTAWYDAVYDSVELVAPLEGRRSVILLSDGIDCREGLIQRLLGRGSTHTLDEAIGRAQSAGIPVYAIGLGKQAADEVSNEGFDPVKLKRVALETGGKYTHAPTAAELRELYESLSVAIQKEYILTYRSPRPTYDGTRRDIAITIKQGGAGGATTRGGYLEKHLINIRSDWRWFLLLCALLLLASLIPSTVGAGLRTRRRAVSDVALVTDAAVSLICPSCGNAVRQGARFCGTCRQPVGPAVPTTTEAEGYCPECGYPNRVSARFCGGCRRLLQ